MNMWLSEHSGPMDPFTADVSEKLHVHFGNRSCHLPESSRVMSYQAANVKLKVLPPPKSPECLVIAIHRNPYSTGQLKLYRITLLVTTCLPCQLTNCCGPPYLHCQSYMVVQLLCTVSSKSLRRGQQLCLQLSCSYTSQHND